MHTSGGNVQIAQYTTSLALLVESPSLAPPTTLLELSSAILKEDCKSISKLTRGFGPLDFV